MSKPQRAERSSGPLTSMRSATLLTPHQQPLDERPGFLARRMHQIHVALFVEKCGSYGVTPVQYSLLTALATRGTADQTTLAADIALDRTTTTGALKRLQARGLIERMVSPQDQRARACKLTAKGAAVLQQMGNAAAEAHAATISVLHPDEQETLIRLLGRIVQAHSDLTGPPNAVD